MGKPEVARSRTLHIDNKSTTTSEACCISETLACFNLSQNKARNMFFSYLSRGREKYENVSCRGFQFCVSGV